MKILFIPDVHGKDIWKKIIEQEPDYDKVIFGGDYCDSYTIPPEEIIKNFNEILQFKDENPDKVVLLMGNHEYHYSKWATLRFSGFNLKTHVALNSVITNAVRDNKLKICHKEGNILFSHAGISKKWCKDFNIRQSASIANNINALFKTRPEAFNFQYLSYSTCNYGNNIYQSPLWIRPTSLNENCIKRYKQVVGHTPHNTISTVNTITYCDTLEHGDESYLVINNGKFETKHVK